MKLITQDGTTYPLTQPLMTIGRDPGCDIALAHDDRVSRQHAQLQVSGGQVVIADLGSRNGTFVNGARLDSHTPYTLGPGDVITVGGTNLTYQAEYDLLATRADLDQYAPPGPVQPQAPAAEMVPYPVAVPYPGYGARPRKDRSTAITLEVLFGLFGLLGIGWIYADNVGIGLIILILYLMMAIFFYILDAFTYGLCCLITFPIQIVIMVLSVTMLSDYINKRTDLFG